MTDRQESARQATFLVVGKVLTALSDAVIPILLVRLLTQTDMGIFTAVLVIYSILAPFLTAAFPATLMYFLPTRSPSERRVVVIRVALTLLGLGTTLGIIMASMGLFAIHAPEVLEKVTDQVVGETSAVGPSGLKYLLALAVLPIGDLPARMLPNLLVVEGRARESAIIGVCKSLATAIFTLAPIFLGFGLWGLTVSIATLGLLHGSLVPIYIMRLYPRGEKTGASVSLKALFGFAVPMGLTNVVSTLNAKLDQTLIAFSFAARMMAQYRMGAWEIPLITSVAYSVGSVITPQLTKLFGVGKFKEGLDLWRDAASKVSLIVVPIAFVFIVGAEETITLLFTDKYEHSVAVFRCYSLMMLGRVAGFGGVIVAAGKPRYVFQAALFTLLSNVLLSVPALIFIGFLGPAVGTAVAFIPTVVYYCWCISRATGVPIRHTFPLVAWLKVVGTATVGAALAVLFKVSVTWHPGAELAGIALIVIGSFLTLGIVTGLIGKNETDFPTQWFKKKK